MTYSYEKVYFYVIFIDVVSAFDRVSSVNVDVEQTCVKDRE